MQKKIFLALLVLCSLILFSSCGAEKHELPFSFTVEGVYDAYVPADENSTNVQEYPTIIQLQHQENDADNGKLLVTFEKWGDT